MGTLFVPIEDDASFSVQGSNYNVVANFSSDQKDVYLRTFAQDNSNVGFLWGVSNITASAPKMVVGQMGTGAASNIPNNDLTIYNGNVGVGVTDVARYKLDVDGDVNYTGGLYNKGTRVNFYPVNSSIGIGTTAPQSTLDVRGAVRVAQNGGPVAEFYDADFPASPPVLIVADNQRVGVNTAAPQDAVHVVGNVRSERFVSTVATGTAPFSIMSTTINTNLNAEYLGGFNSAWYQTASNITIGTLNTYVLPASGVTAGTYGDASNVARVAVDTYGRVTSAASAPIYIHNTRVIGLCNVATTANYNDLINKTFVLSGGTDAVYNGGNVGIGNNPDAGMKLHVETTSTDSLIRVKAPSASVVAGVECVRNTNPILGARLVYATSANYTYIQTINGTSYSSYFSINNANGQVGIRTSVPQNDVHIMGNTTVTGTLRATTLNADDITAGTLSATILPVVPGLTAASYGTAASNAVVTVDTKGRVTAIQNQAVSIQRAAVVGLIDPWAQGTPTSTVYYSAGNVGIGTSVANERLHVQGNQLIAGSLLPATCNAYDIGSSTARFGTMFLSSNALNIEGSRMVVSTSSNMLFLRNPDGTNATYLNVYVNDMYASNVFGSNLKSSAYVDTTNATNITSGTLNEQRLPVVGGLTAGTYGTPSNVPIVTVDTRGRVTTISNGSTIDYNTISNRPFENKSATTIYTLAANVGIGTTTPLAALSLGTGATDTSSYMLFNSSDTATNTNKIIFTFVQDGSRIGHSSGWSVNHYAGTSNSATGSFRFYVPSGVANGGYNECVSFIKTGNVGIGSTVPAFALDVATGTGDINFKGSLIQNATTTIVSSAGVLNSNVLPVIAGVTAATYGSASAVPVVTVDTRGRITSISTSTTIDYNNLLNKTFVLSGGSNAVYTTTNGNVGIGTTLTQAVLHVQGTTGVELFRVGTGANQGINVSTSSGNNASGTPDYVYIGCKPALAGGVSGGSFQPAITLVNTSPRTYADVALVQSGGSVGIGTTLAVGGAKLHVQGVLNVTDTIRQGGVDIVSNSTLSAAALPDVATVTAGSYGNASNVATFSVDAKGRVTTASSVAINNIPATSILGLCNVARTANYTDLSNVPLVRNGGNVTYTESGNIGIGYANPQYKLAVAGSIYSDATVFASNLTILGEFTTLNTVTSNTDQVFVQNAGTGPALYVQQSGPQPVAYFYDDTAIAMSIADGGNVGIGTTNAQYKLEIVNGGLNVQNGGISQNGTVVVSGTTGLINSNVLPIVSTITSGTYGGGTALNIPEITIDNRGRITAITTKSPMFEASAFSDTTNANNITFGTLSASRLPTVAGITTGTYGGAANKILSLGVDTTGRITSVSEANPNFAQSAFTDTTNATNITTGTFNAGRLPTVPGLSTGTYGGAANKILGLGVDTTGRITSVSEFNPNFVQSAFTDTTNAANISTGTLNAGRLPTVPGLTAATYGTRSNVPQVTVDATGRVTAITASQVIDYNDLLNKTFTISGANNAVYTNGNVGIGTTTPTVRLDVVGTVRATQFIGDGSLLTGVATTGGGGTSSQWSDSNVGSSSNIYFDKGYVGIGTSSPKYMLHVTQDLFANNVITYSDAKYKTNVATINNALDTVNKLRGVTYSLQHVPNKLYMGVIAQEVEPHVPEVVYTDVDGMKSVSYGNMVGVLIEAMKDMTKIIQRQAADIEELKLALRPT